MPGYVEPGLIFCRWKTAPSAMLVAEKGQIGERYLSGGKT